ncbi:hypothetical protein PHEL85_3315 [Polaribacter sp. Hel1_85]|nr:hypothetical protein PHEL85_3315 [Polaribacter sp. Hel1_85]
MKYFFELIINFLMTYHHILIIASIIIFVGAFAGFTNYLQFLHKGLVNKKDEIVKYIFSGVGAAMLVPLLLNMLSSNLIIYGDNFELINYFVFAGFCFIAGYYSDRFIFSIADKVLKDLESTKKEIDKVKTETEDNEEKIDLLISNEVETDDDGEKSLNNNLESIESNISSQNFDINIDIKDLIELTLNSFNGKHKFRTLKGLSKELGKSEKLVVMILTELEKYEIVKKVILKDRIPFWALTKIGKSMLKK